MRRRTLIRAGDDIRVIRGSKPVKKVSKIEKKACQPLASSARPDLRATNSTVWPFKKSTKKVKKKLVRPLEI
jgi:hypothetical protein